MNLTINQLIKEGSKKLQNISDSPLLDSEILLAFVLNISRYDLFLRSSEQVNEDKYHKFLDFISRRVSSEPVAYITNEKHFFEDVFYVDNRVLIPRPETEFLVIEAVSRLKVFEFKPSVLDMCCGSGCIGLSILRVIDCILTFSDVSADALSVAEINFDNLFNSIGNVEFVESNLFENINKKYDLITANPPYLSKNDMNNLVENSLKYEPDCALYGGESGFEISEIILNNVHKFLNPEGIVIIELGHEGIKFLNNTFQNIKLNKIIKDYSKIERVAVFSLCK